MEKQSNDLMEKLFRLEAMLHRCQGCRFREFGPFGDPLRGQGRVLSILKLQPQISQRELTFLLDMRQQSLSELLKKLESRGLILRAPSEDDRRAVMITLTEEGKSAAAGAVDSAAGSGGMFDCFSMEEQGQFEAFLDRLTDSLEKTLEASDQRPHGRGRGEECRHDGRHEDPHCHGRGEHRHGAGRNRDGNMPPHRGQGPHPGFGPDHGTGE